MPQDLGLYDVGGGQGKQHGALREMDMTNIIHVLSKATIDYISLDPKGAAAVLALGVAVIVGKWVWNERKGKKHE